MNIDEIDTSIDPIIEIMGLNKRSAYPIKEVQRKYSGESRQQNARRKTGFEQNYSKTRVRLNGKDGWNGRFEFEAAGDFGSFRYGSDACDRDLIPRGDEYGFD